MKDTTITSDKIYDEAKRQLGNSLVPVGDNPDLGCAISLSVLLHDICGIEIKKTFSTFELQSELIASPFFTEVSNPLAGDVIIDATGTSSIPNTPIKNGHCGIYGLYGIMSNSSLTGLWSENYTIQTWKNRYEKQGGYPTRYFRAK